MPDDSLCTGGVWRVGCWALYYWICQVSSEVHVSMALILLFFCSISVVFHCLALRRVGGSCAPRVSPAVTRLTVHPKSDIITIALDYASLGYTSTIGAVLNMRSLPYLLGDILISQIVTLERVPHTRASFQTFSGS